MTRTTVARPCEFRVFLAGRIISKRSFACGSGPTVYVAAMTSHTAMSAIARSALVALLGTCAATALTPVGPHAQPVVQQLPNPASERLNDALRRLARNPESLPALLAAGRASLELDDVDAAAGFFSRAQAVAPADGSVLAGLAMVALRQEDPRAALDLFEQAEAAGENLDPYAADQGLAHDLVGNNARAQELYGVALSRNESAETVRRMALSYAIAGDQAASEATLLPLLQRRDLAAYRTRAFALAILGREEEAVSIAETMLPARLARRLTPYLRYMPRLTRSQQAAAANLGNFPDLADIGRDDPQLARSAGRSTQPAASNNVAARLIPGGQPLGDRQAELPAISAPEVSAPEETALAEVLPEEEPVVVAALEEEAQIAPRPSFSISDSAPAAPEPAPARPEEVVSVTDAFADFSLGDSGLPAQAVPGAGDITAIEPVREKREPEPPPPPVHPSRHWVQVATGQDISAFRFDWRRIVRNSGGLLDDRQAYRARWNQTNRLVTGPFDSAGDAQDFVTALGREGVDAFRFTSAVGEEVVALD